MFDLKGDRPQWQTIYDHIATMNIGDLVKDADLFALLPDAPEASVRGAFWRAVREVEDNHHRTFDRVRTVGYRMVEAAEHVGLAKRQHVRAKRRLAAGIRKAHSADRTLLGREDRRRVDAIEEHLNQQAQMIRRLEARQEKTDDRVARTEKDSAQLADRIDALTDMLARHGIAT